MHRRRFASLAAASLALAHGARAQPATLHGTATYRERMALPPGAVLEVALLDIARADAPADRLAAATIPIAGQVPIPFALPYDPARLSPRGRHAVSGRILLDGRVLFRTDSVHPVDPAAPSPVELRLVRAAGDAPPGAAANPLTGRRWVAEDIDGKGVLDRIETSLTLLEGEEVAGTGGCNRFRGGYRREGAEGLAFGPLASTMMMCPEAIAEQEQRFHAALGATRRWRIDPDGALLLLDAGERPLVRLRPMAGGG